MEQQHIGLGDAPLEVTPSELHITSTNRIEEQRAVQVGVLDERHLHSAPDGQRQAVSEVMRHSDKVARHLRTRPRQRQLGRRQRYDCLLCQSAQQIQPCSTVCWWRNQLYDLKLSELRLLHLPVCMDRTAARGDQRARRAHSDPTQPGVLESDCQCRGSAHLLAFQRPSSPPLHRCRLVLFNWLGFGNCPRLVLGRGGAKAGGPDRVGPKIAEPAPEARCHRSKTDRIDAAATRCTKKAPCWWSAGRHYRALRKRNEIGTPPAHPRDASKLSARVLGPPALPSRHLDACVCALRWAQCVGTI